MRDTESLKFYGVCINKSHTQIKVYFALMVVLAEQDEIWMSWQKLLPILNIFVFNRPGNSKYH